MKKGMRQRERRREKGENQETAKPEREREGVPHLPPSLDQHKEEGEEQAILALLGQCFQLQAVTMDTLLEGGALVPVVEIESVRESYTLRGGGWKVGR